MDEIWAKLYAAAKAVQQERQISDYVLAGGVAAAVLSKSGRIYTGVCIDTCSTLGICAERNAIFNMITNGEQEIDKVLCILPDGSGGALRGVSGTYGAADAKRQVQGHRDHDGLRRRTHRQAGRDHAGVVDQITYANTKRDRVSIFRNPVPFFFSGRKAYCSSATFFSAFAS